MISKDYSIRPMRAADVSRVMEIAEKLGNAPKWPRSAYLSALNTSVSLERVVLVTVDGDDDPVGFAVASLVPPSAELETVVVAGNEQRRGLGRSLLEHLFEELKGRRVNEVWLEVRASNVPAAELYQALGFVEISRRKDYYADPTEDACVMRLTIG